MMNAVATLLVLALMLVVIWAIVLFLKTLLGFESALVDVERRLRRLRAFSAEALRLAETRGRFRRGQRSVERAVDVGTTGMENAHRTLAGHRGRDYRSAAFYGGLRRVNRTVGRSMSNWLAPRSRAARGEHDNDED